MNNTPTQLFSARSTNGQSAVFPSRGVYATVIASGTFSGGTITVQASPDGGTTWVDTNATLAAAGLVNFIAGDGISYRLNLSGAGTPSIDAWVAFES